MAVTNGNGAGAKIEAVTESVTVRLVSRAAMVATPVLIAIFGWILMEIWNEQKALNKELAAGLQNLNTRVLTIEVKREMEGKDTRRHGRSSRTFELPPAALPPPED